LEIEKKIVLYMKKGSSVDKRLFNGREEAGVEERRLGWKRGGWCGREEAGVEERRLVWKRGGWCGREDAGVEERRLVWKRGGWSGSG
jgi:hypothetical protein